MSDGRLRSRWQLPFAGRIGRERDSTAQPRTYTQFQKEEDASTQLGNLDWSHGSGCKEKGTRQAAPIERSMLGDENCQPSSNHAQDGPSGNSMQSDGVPLSPGTQALLDVLHRSRTDSKQEWAGEEGHLKRQTQGSEDCRDRDSTPSGSCHLSACGQQVDIPSNPDLMSPDLSNVGSSEPEQAKTRIAPFLPLAGKQPHVCIHPKVAQEATDHRYEAALEAPVPSELERREGALQTKHTCSSMTQSVDTKRSPDLLTEFLQLSLQPPSTADATARPISTPKSEPELFHCQRLMVSALPTPPEDSNTTAGRSGAVPSEEASGTAAPSLSTQWQCSTSTVWTLSPAPDDSELKAALHVSPLQMQGTVKKHATVVGSPRIADSAGSQQHHGPEVPQADYVSVHSPAQLLVPNAGHSLQPAVDVIINPPEGASVATSSSHATNSECPSLQNVPEVSAYMELPHSNTASTSDADSRNPAETSPLLVDFSRQYRSECLESPMNHGGHCESTQSDCSPQPSLNEVKEVGVKQHVDFFHGSDGSHTQQRGMASKDADNGRLPSLGASMNLRQESTPLARAVCARSHLLSPPATGWSSANDSEPPHQQFSTAGEAPGTAHKGESSDVIQEGPAEMIGSDHCDVGASAEELQRSWTRLQMNTCDSATINAVGPQSDPEQVTARDWLPPALSLRPDKLHSEQISTYNLRGHHRGAQPCRKDESGSEALQAVSTAQQHKLHPDASTLRPFQRAVLSNTRQASESGACAPTQSESPVQRRRLQQSFQARHRSPGSPGLENRGARQELEDVGTPPLSVRASSTLHELLKSDCGRNAQSAIREVLACLAAEERMLEEATAPHFNSPPCGLHNHGAVHLATKSGESQEGNSATDTSQSNDTILEASSQISNEHQSQDGVSRCPGAVEDQGAFMWDGEETVRVVASSCDLNFQGTNRCSDQSGMPSKSHMPTSNLTHTAAPRTSAKQSIRTIQTKFSLVSTVPPDSVACHSSSQQAHSLQAGAGAPDCAPVKQLQQKKQLVRRKAGPVTKSGAPGRLSALPSAQIRSKGGAAATASTVSRSKVHSEKVPNVPTKKVRAQQSRSINTTGTSNHDGTVEQPAWKPPCGPLATSVDTPRSRVSPIPQQGYLPVQVAPAAPRASKGPVKGKRKKKLKTKLKSAKGALATHETVSSPPHSLGWEHVNGDNDVFFPGGGLQGLFGTKESRAATLAQIREVQAATAMAATAPLRQGRTGPGTLSRAGRSLSRSAATAELPCSGSTFRSQDCGIRQRENMLPASTAADVPHALHAAAARMGCQLVPVQDVHDSAYKHSNGRGVPHRAPACKYKQGTTEWPSASARWSPNECIFRSSKGGTQGQSVYGTEATAVHRDGSDFIYDLSMQMNPAAGQYHVSGFTGTNSQVSGTATPAATSSPGSTNAVPNGCPKVEQNPSSLSGAIPRRAEVAGCNLEGRDQLVDLEYTRQWSGPCSGWLKGSDAGSQCDYRDDVGDPSTWPALRSCGLEGDTGFVSQPAVRFSAGQPNLEQPQPGRRSSTVANGRRKLSVAELPSYGDKHRRTPRENVPHDGNLLAGFSPWIEVSFFTWRDAILQVPQCPGVYEWGALRHGCSYPKDVIAFYVGKAGTHFLGRGQATLASRFMRYVQMHDNFIGPARAGRECVKTQLFQYFQKHGFRLFFRWRQCIEPEEPADAEEELLATYDYPGNERANRGYRQVMLPGGKALHKLPKGGFL